MDTLRADIKVGIRGLLSRPAWTLTVLLTLALGMGVNTAIFTLVDGVLLKPLPFPHPERLVEVFSENPGEDLRRFTAAPPDLRDWRENNRSFAGLAASWELNYNLNSPGEEPERLPGAAVSGNYFEVLGERPALGRLLNEGDGHQNVAVLTYDLWMSRYHGSPAVLGKALTLNSDPFTVVGVMPRSLVIPAGSEIFVPLNPQVDESTRGSHTLNVIGRLKPEASIHQAQAEINAVEARLAKQFQRTNAGWDVVMYPLQDLVVEDIRPALLVLWCTVALLLLTACANVTNLLLVRFVERTREVAIRSALGAARGRILRQFVVEIALLSAAAGALGLVIGAVCVRALVGVNAARIPRVEEVGFDLRVYVFALLLSVFVAVWTSVLPMVFGMRPDLKALLSQGGQGSVGGGRGGRTVRDLLVVGEVAMALTLLVGAGLLLRSFSRLSTVDPGFHSSGVMTMQVSVQGIYSEKPQKIGFYRSLVPRLQALPGVRHAATLYPVPLGGSAYVNTFTGEGYTPATPGQFPNASIHFISPDYLAAMGIALARGRHFTDADDINSPRVLLVNESLARHIWPGLDAIGRRITFEPHDADPKWQTVVGVVRDVRHRALTSDPELEIYTPSFQSPTTSATLIIRTDGPQPLALAGSVRRVVHEVNGTVPVYKVRSLDDIVAESMADQRFDSELLAVFALLTLGLAALGVYGVMAYAVTLRTREVGLRMALGALPGAVLGLLLRDGARVIFAGIGLGLALAIGLSPLLRKLLFGVGAFDPLTFVGASLLLVGVALVANYLPALRATRVPPASVLR